MGVRFDVTDSNGKTTDFTKLIAAATLSGDYRQCCRTLTLQILVSPYDKTLPAVFFPVGGTVRMYVDTIVRFYGPIVTKKKATDSSKMTVTCFDRGFYLKNNYATYSFKNQTPEAITARICKDFGISLYRAQETDIKITRKFSSTPLYQIIDTVYTLASQKTGKKYFTRFVADKFGVFYKGLTQQPLLLENGRNLQASAYTESIETMVNRVSIYDSEDKFVKSVSEEDAIALYGLLRKIIRQGKGEDATADAKKTLQEYGLQRTATVTVFPGTTSLVVGESVLVKEPYTGLSGLFFVDADVHTLQNGVWTSKLTLHFENMMRESTSGTEEKTTNKKK